MRISLACAAILAAAMCGCSTSTTETAEEWLAAVRACHLENDGSITMDDDIRACDPGNTKKTTICHIPPGNPSNAHTICVGNAAVAAHVRNHGDTIGPCPVETPCGTPDASVASSPDAGVVTTPDAGQADAQIIP